MRSRLFPALFAGLLLIAGAPSLAGPFAYIAHTGANNVSVVDTTTNAIAATIAIPGPRRVAINPAGTRAYVTSSGSAVYVIDTATYAVTANIPVASGAGDVAVHPSGTTVYATSSTSGPGQVYVIDAASNTVTTSIFAAFAYRLAVTPDGARVYVTQAQQHGGVTVIDTATNSVLTSIGFPPGSVPGGVAIDAAGTYAYVTNAGGIDRVMEIDIATNTLRAGPFNTGSGPSEVVAGKRIASANFLDNSVSMFLDSLHSVQIPVGPAPSGMALGPGGSKAYVTNNGANSVSVINLEADQVDVTTFGVGPGPTGIAVYPGPNPPRLANISTRGQVLSGSDVMIAGFVIGGSAPKTVAVTVAGPSLANSGITNPLANPTLTLVRSSDGVVLGGNNDWQTAPNAAQIQALGLAPADPLEPAVMMSLAPGAYTAIVQGAGGGTGVGLVGVFEVDRPDVPLLNISTRGHVATSNDVMVAGIIVQGTGSQTVVVNVAGPSLSNFGVANPLGNPTLTIVRASDNAVIATNDNWQAQTNPADVAAIQASGFQPNNSLEPAVILTLPPGAYTAIVQGAGGGTGVGVVGVFRTP